MSRLRSALILCAVLAAVGAALLYLAPLEDETCAQVYEELYGTSHDARLVQTTLWQCFGAIRTARARINSEAELEKTRQLARALEQARVAAERATDASRPVRVLPLPPVRSENEQALIAQVRPSLCAQLAPPAPYSLHLVQASGDVILYSLSAECPECRFKQAPAVHWLRADGTPFCVGGGATGGDCAAKFAPLKILTQVDQQGTSASLRAWLGCP